MKQRSKSLLASIAMTVMVPVSFLANSAVLAAPAEAGGKLQAGSTAAAKRPVKFDIHKYESSKLVPEAQITVTNLWGDVRLRTHRDPNVKVEGALQRIGEDAPEPAFKPVENEKTFEFTVDIPDGVYEPRSNRVDLVVYVPGKSNVKIMTRDGSIEAKKTIMNLDAQSESGNITITNHGSVNAKSVKGKVQVQPMYAGWGEINIDAGEAGAIAFLPDGDNFSLEVNGATELNTEFELEGELPGPLKMQRGLGNDKYRIQAAGPVKVFKAVKPKRSPSRSMYQTLNESRAKKRAEEKKLKQEQEKAAAEKSDNEKSDN